MEQGVAFLSTVFRAVSLKGRGRPIIYAGILDSSEATADCNAILATSPTKGGFEKQKDTEVMNSN